MCYCTDLMVVCKNDIFITYSIFLKASVLRKENLFLNLFNMTNENVYELCLNQ